MGRELPVLIVVAGAGVLALWLYVRLGARGPRSLKLAAVQLLIACAAMSAAPPIMDQLLGESLSGGRALIALLAVFLPAMTYTFLAVLYFFAHLQRRLYLR